MTTANNKLVALATYIILFLPAVAVTSPALSNLLEALLFLLFITTHELRTRFIASCKQPIVKFGFLFVLVIILSSIWSPADWETKRAAIISWRKILLLPIVISLINSSILKDRLLLTFIIFSSIASIFSWYLYLGDMNIFHKMPNEILRSHVTQGMVFFIASYFAGSMLIYKKELSFKVKALLSFSLLLLLSNIFIISTGRSGYIIGLVLLISLSLFTKKKKSILMVSVLLITMLSLLYISPTANSQIQKAINNLSNVENAKEYSSAGIRVIFWKNSIEIIKTMPFTGYGLKSFEFEYKKQVEGIEGWKAVITGDPHNQYLLILVEQGVIGLFVFFAFILSCFFQKVDDYYRRIGIAILLGWMATSFFHGHFSASIEGRLVLLLCASMLAMPVYSGSKNSNKELPT